MVRVLMMLTSTGRPIHHRMRGSNCIAPYIKADPKPKRKSWPRLDFCWVEGKMVKDLGEDLAVEVLTTGGKVVFTFNKRDVNIHGRVRDDEIALLRACQKGRIGGQKLEHMDHIVPALNIHPNRAFRILEKWEGRGWWECGVGTWYGWMTPSGERAAV